MHLTDQDLVLKSLHDMEAFGELISRYEAPLKRYVIRISNLSEECVEEVIQDVFLKCWKNLRAFKPDVKFSSWIYRIAHNETISLFRKWKSRGADKAIELHEEIFAPDPNSNFAKELDQEISAHQIQEIFTHMKKKHREILTLRFFEDKSYDEISDILHRPPGTVATLLNRAKKEFKSIAHRLNIHFS